MSNEKTGRLDWLMLLYTQATSTSYKRMIVRDIIMKEFGIKDPSKLIKKNGWVLKEETLDEILGLQ